MKMTGILVKQEKCSSEESCMRNPAQSIQNQVIIEEAEKHQHRKSRTLQKQAENGFPKITKGPSAIEYMKAKM